MKKIKVLIVDDSALFRRFLCDLLRQDQTLFVVGTAADAHEAGDKVASLRPDVLTLDIEMPGISGIDFLRKLMQTNPLPVIMVSSYTEENGLLTIEALATGAVDFVLKPVNGGTLDKENFAREVVQKIKTAAVSKIEKSINLNRMQKRRNRLRCKPQTSTRQMVAIGASTGGTRAIYEVLRALPPDTPGIAVVQHMPPKFTRLFARRMNELCPMFVKEAEDMDYVQPGHVLIAPGDRHMEIEGSKSGHRVRLSDGPPVNFHRPSIDVFFQSVAETVGNKAVGVILTGMGTDGAKGLLAMRRNGAYTIAQDKETSLIFGMPGAAIKLGASCEVAPIHKMPESILTGLSTGAI
ncbi:MAG: chemotaxis response regulator protein-glutamate methylesterase [Deltaproteobacteria bacterium]|nr:chemotaxis response regulator protein-glutamate methylesterase [Deltaproteobacteria bacterium]